MAEFPKVYYFGINGHFAIFWQGRRLVRPSPPLWLWVIMANTIILCNHVFVICFHHWQLKLFYYQIQHNSRRVGNTFCDDSYDKKTPKGKGGGHV